MGGKKADSTTGVDPLLFDAVVLDLTMPNLGGQECLGELHRGWPDLPVILMSGYSETEVIERVGGLPLAGFLKKPFDSRSLLDCLNRALS